jgi:excisionase family DNA binding protein
MYTITRQEAAEVLNISTRSIDRYIRAGKLRSMKDGKIIYINDKDIQNLKSGEAAVQEVIIPIRKETPDYQRTYSHTPDEVHFEKKEV